MNPLKEFRRKKHLSQQEMSDTLGITVRSYRNYEYGNRQIPYDILAKFLYMRNELDDRKLAKILDEISNDNKIIALIDDNNAKPNIVEELKKENEKLLKANTKLSDKNVEIKDDIIFIGKYLKDKIKKPSDEIKGILNKYYI